MITLLLLLMLALCIGFLPAYLILPGFIQRTHGDRLRALARAPQTTFGRFGC